MRRPEPPMPSPPRSNSPLDAFEPDQEADFTGAGDEIDRVDISSVNNLIGVQFGVEGMTPIFDSVSIGGRATVGLYANHATLDRGYSATMRILPLQPTM